MFYTELEMLSAERTHNCYLHIKYDLQMRVLFNQLGDV